MGNNKAAEIIEIINIIRAIVPNIELVLFDRGFYNKEVMDELNRINIPYLIFVPKNDQIKRELEAMQKEERKIEIYEFEYYKDKNKRTGFTYLAFLKQIFDHESETYYDWAFATNLSEIDLKNIIGTYKLRWNIEVIFKVQDQCKIQTKSKDILVRYFLFAYEQLIEALWYL
ncbi:MAG: transposase, partial [Thermoplasmata archaeon]